MSNLLQELLAAPPQRLSVEFREDLAKAVSQAVVNQGGFQMIVLRFETEHTGVMYDWTCRQTVRYGEDSKTAIPWSETVGRKFTIEVAAFFVEEHFNGDECE